MLVDGANPQIEAIRAAAAKRAVTIHIVIDLIHVLQYPHQADRVLHGDGEQAETAVAEHALAVLSGRCAQVADPRHDTEGRQKISETITYLRNKENHLHYDRPGQRPADSHRNPRVRGRVVSRS